MRALAIIPPRVLEGVTNNFFGARPANELQTLIDLFGLPVLDARVQILFVLAHDHHVHARMLGLNVRGIRNARPHIRIQAERFARSHIERLEAATLRSRDRRFEENLRAP